VRISSTQNATVKFVRSLQRSAAAREAGVFLSGGVRFVGNAMAAGQHADLVLYDPSLLERTAEGSSLLSALPAFARVTHEVSLSVLKSVADTESPAGVVAVLRRPDAGAGNVATGRAVVVLDAIGDPGNAGTIMRTAAAAGCGAVLAAPDTVDLFAPKVVRAGMGAHFRLAVRQPVDYAELRSALPGYTVIACEMHGARSIYQMSWPHRMALIVGSEAHGLGVDAQQIADETVRIPMAEGVESLNAAVAAAVVLYEALGRSLDAG
jgi:RNA methyltransferase, TrmH family